MQQARVHAVPLAPPDPTAGAAPEGGGTAPQEKLPLRVVPREPGPAAPAGPRPWRPLLRGLRLALAAMALVALGGIVGLYVQPAGLQRAMALLGLEPGAGSSSPMAVPAPPASLPEPATVVGLGRLVPAGDVVVVAPPFGAGDARVAAIEVAEGEEVEAGAVLARLDNEASLAAAVASAEATVAAQEAVLARTRADVAASRDEARAELARAEAALANAQAEFARVQELFDRGVTTQAELDARRAARDQAAQDVARAGAALGRYDVGEPDAQPDVRVAARNLDAARADLVRAERDLDTALVRAPISGTVLEVHVRVGERPGEEGLMDLADLSRMTAEVEVYQGEIGRVALGAPVTLTAEALREPLRGTVARVGLEVGRQTLVGADPAANTDARVVEVTVALDEASTALARRFTNLQVLGRIEVGGGDAPGAATGIAPGIAPGAASEAAP